MAIGSALVDWVSHHRSAQLAIGRSVQPLVGRSVQPLVDRFSHQLSHSTCWQVFTVHPFASLHRLLLVYTGALLVYTGTLLVYTGVC